MKSRPFLDFAAAFELGGFLGREVDDDQTVNASLGGIRADHLKASIAVLQ
jgi:hypothetical protein